MEGRREMLMERRSKKELDRIKYRKTKLGNMDVEGLQ